MTENTLNASAATSPSIGDDSQTRYIVKHLITSYAPLLITGEAGTGKSTLIRYLRECGHFPNMVVTAPTGIAAINIAGQTLHSFFRLPPRIIEPSALTGQRANRLWKKVDIIIVDEISMVRADIIDGMDHILRKARRDPRPFGGVKMVFVGDFYQLPPVVRNPESDILRRMGYATPFAYSAHVFAELTPERVNLTTVHRQSDDRFKSLLSRLRRGADVQESLSQLNTECAHDHRAGRVPLLLTATNHAAKGYNARALSQIGNPVQRYTGQTQGKFNISGDALPVAETLELKVGARVMALKNDPSKRWVNGSLGTVSALSSDSVSVKFDHSGRTGEVKAASWETLRYGWDEAKNQPTSEVTGAYTQIPLTLAWAVTIHKAQGLTLDDVRVDLGRGAFASGQAYVALSRATSLAGLSLTRPLRPDDVQVERAHQIYLRDE